jgi:alpha-beta hydrolase superfamily lysophospholipase
LTVAQLAFNADTDRKRSLYAKLTAEVNELSSEWPDNYREVRVPVGESALYALLVLPDGVAAPNTIILFGGLNGWGAAYLGIADSFAQAGLACLLVELPGQGNTRLRENLYADHATVGAVSACVDWIRSTNELSDQVGVCGNSFGGLFAALSASADPRIGAVCINGAPPIPTLPPFRTAQELMLGFFGVESPELVNEILPTIEFRDKTIACPVLVLHGGADRLVSEAEQRVFLDAATGSATWREWPDGQHTMYNHAIERNAIVTSWFARALAG